MLILGILQGNPTPGRRIISWSALKFRGTGRRWDIPGHGLENRGDATAFRGIDGQEVEDQVFQVLHRPWYPKNAG